ncbi:hypothetical protein [uncultured Sutterella sp.]|uniref:hypothetical protein n=1 Tax=uncultured Sutterella sp. TaxID=286133 RepID=UPI0026703431|nr:hypothetical protein [uncultured Sutterella sp.]
MTAIRTGAIFSCGAPSAAKANIAAKKRTAGLKDIAMERRKRMGLVEWGLFLLSSIHSKVFSIELKLSRSLPATVDRTFPNA